jgi:hypothetical protein
MAISYSDLKERVGRHLFGIRTGFSADQLDDINDCIKDGLLAVYGAYQWSFLRPLETIVTAADDSTYELAADCDSIEGGVLTFAAEEGEGYPPVQVVAEVEVRRRRQECDDTGVPRLAALLTDVFDPEAGSSKSIVLYPTPDGIYNLTVPMRLRPTMIDDNHPYPIGGEVMSAVILESCLAAAERNYDEKPGIHNEMFARLLEQTIDADKSDTTPRQLGQTVKDDGTEWLPRTNLMGAVTINGVTM